MTIVLIQSIDQIRLSNDKRAAFPAIMFIFDIVAFNSFFTIIQTKAMVTSPLYDTGKSLTFLRAQFQSCYDQLSRIAHNKLRYESALHTFDTSALVHEVYDNMFRNKQYSFQNSSHFLAIAAIVMRRILIDYARQKKSQKRGGDLIRMTYGAVNSPVDTTPEEILLMDESLKRLRQLNKRQSRVVEYYFFGGYKHEEIAGIMNVSVDTVRRDWRLAKAWLSAQMKR
ncbi:MAG TPA: ECF-type sigma factor [Cyclobacteriaceae bacterium]|nr:ECF-type sigma factor [Cyclobacteriaceae bacterium]